MIDAAGKPTAVLTRRDGLPGTRVTGLGLEPSGHLKATTEGGRADLAREGDRWVITLLPPRTAAPDPRLSGLDGRTVFALLEHRDELLVGTLEGLHALGPDHSSRLVSTSDVRALARVGDTVLYGTYGDGLFRLDGTRIAGVPSDARVNGLGSSGGVVCAATASGLFVDRGAGFRHVELPGPSSNDISAVASARGLLYVGTFDSGLSVFDGERWSEPFAGSLDPRVNALTVDAASGDVWVGTERGLVRIHAGALEKIDLPSPVVHSLSALREGGVLVGTADGAALVRNGAVTIIGPKQGLSERTIWAVGEDPRGSLWFGTSRGLLSRDRSGRWRRQATSSGELPDDWVTALAFHGSDVFVGTYAGGVTRLSRGAKGTRVGSRLGDGAGHVNLGGLTVHAGALLAATMEGLRAGPDLHLVSDAAPGADVTGFAIDGPTLWVASRRGLAGHPTTNLMTRP